MKSIKKQEIFEHLSSFLKTKGIEMRDGSYSQGIQKACEILTDTVNLSQRGLERAKDTVGQNLDKVRQVIHERTAPKPPVNPTPRTNSGTGKARAKPSSKKPKAQGKSRKPRR